MPGLCEMLIEVSVSIIGEVPNDSKINIPTCIVFPGPGAEQIPSVAPIAAATVETSVAI